MAKGKKTGGGSRKGKRNKSTQELKEILEREVDFAVVIRKLLELVEGVEVQEDSKDGKGGTFIYTKEPSVPAAKLLLEYGFGKPKEYLDVTSDGEKIELVKVQIIRKANAKKEDTAN